MISRDLKDLTDEQLVELCNENRQVFNELLSRYSNVIRIKARSMGNNFADVDDLMQEGLLGLVSAAITFDKSKGATFATYSNICISNKMKSVLRSGKGFSETEFSDDIAQRAGFDSSPESIFIEQEKDKEISDELKLHLSEKEWQIFKLFLAGSSYSQIADQLNIPFKAVDNALQRVRNKLKVVWRNRFI